MIDLASSIQLSVDIDGSEYLPVTRNDCVRSLRRAYNKFTAAAFVIVG